MDCLSNLKNSCPFLKAVNLLLYILLFDVPPIVCEGSVFGPCFRMMNSFARSCKLMKTRHVFKKSTMVIDISLGAQTQKSEYDQEILQSQTADKPMAPR